MFSWEVPVTSGPGDATYPATGSGREQVIAALKAAFIQGRLTKDEFDLRVGQALAIYAELDALTADIPAAVPPAVKPQPAPTRDAADKKTIQRGTALGAGLTFVLESVVVIPKNPALGVVAGVLLSAFVAVLLAGFLTLLSWAFDRRSGGQSAQGPASRGRQPRADQQGWSSETGQDPPHAAQAASRRPRRPDQVQTRRPVLTS
jgi:uncharacterized protein DUF1707